MNPSHENWFYQFTAAQDGVFTMDYDVAISEDGAYGSGNFQILVNGVPPGDLVGGSDGTGTKTYALVAGNDYRFSIRNYAYVSPATEGYNTITGLFTFKILDATAVPEPATWAMMITGFGLVGGSLRRRRTRAGFA